MSILNRLIESLFGEDDIKKEALFHCADGMVRKAAGCILEIGLNRQKITSLLQRGLECLDWIAGRYHAYRFSMIAGRCCAGISRFLKEYFV